MLNGHPVHLFADWGHTVTCFSCVKEWIEKWFSMMKDMGLNASRLHTHPHPKLVMDLADEWGIYIIGETGAHGSRRHAGKQYRGVLGSPPPPHFRFYQARQEQSVGAYVELRQRNALGLRRGRPDAPDRA